MKHTKSSRAYIVDTAYGMKPMNAVPIEDRREILAETAEALSLKSKNPTEFYAKLKQLVKQYK